MTVTGNNSTAYPKQHTARLLAAALLLGMFIACTPSVVAWGQNTLGATPDRSVEPPAWRELNQQRLTTQKRALWTLGGWAVANMAVGLGASFRSSGHWKRFHQFNAAWNTVNLALAGFGLRDVYGANPADFTGLETLQEIQTLQTILLLNAGLDVAYLATGGLLVSRSQIPGVGKPDLLKGFGYSLFLQGGFLLVFDTVFYLLLNSPKQQSLEWLEQLQLQGLGLRYTF